MANGSGGRQRILALFKRLIDAEKLDAPVPNEQSESHLTSPPRAKRSRYEDFMDDEQDGTQSNDELTQYMNHCFPSKIKKILKSKRFYSRNLQTKNYRE